MKRVSEILIKMHDHYKQKGNISIFINTFINSHHLFSFKKKLFFSYLINKKKKEKFPLFLIYLTLRSNKIFCHLNKQV